MFSVGYKEVASALPLMEALEACFSALTSADDLSTQSEYKKHVVVQSMLFATEIFNNKDGMSHLLQDLEKRSEDRTKNHIKNQDKKKKEVK